MKYFSVFVLLFVIFVLFTSAEGKTAEEICRQPKKSGSCYAYFPKFYYNIESGECERFIYGGCQRNDNNFGTKDKCEAICKGKTAEEICRQPKKPGNCCAYFPKFYYNIESGECERFIYGGCHGNDNNFGTKDECEAKCKGVY